MDQKYIQIAGIIGAVILLAIAIFQLLLVVGFPLGEYSWGGKHKGVLPRMFRIISIPSAILLIFMGFVLLMHAKVFSMDLTLPTHSLVWIFTIFLGLNTLGNVASFSFLICQKLCSNMSTSMWTFLHFDCVVKSMKALYHINIS